MRTGLIAGLLGGLLVSPALAMGDGEKVTASLSHKASSRWSIVTPTEVWTTVTEGIKVAINGNGGVIAYPERDGIFLMVDTDGDGKAESKIKGVGGFLKLRGQTENGESTTYGIRFRKAGKWQYAASGAMVGKIHGTIVQLIDLNNNGRYDDYGKDAMILGRSKSASFLSKVVNIDGDLYELSVNKDGTEIETVPYEGETGFIDLKSFTSKGKLACATIGDSSGNLSFNLCWSRGTLKVPAGSYTLTGGCVAKGKETARIGPGRMDPIQVAAGQTAKAAWGGPLTASFNWSRVGNEIKVQPNVKYFGKLGEEYFDWSPDAKSPKLLVFESGKKRPVASGRFAMC